MHLLVTAHVKLNLVEAWRGGRLSWGLFTMVNMLVSSFNKYYSSSWTCSVVASLRRYHPYKSQDVHINFLEYTKERAEGSDRQSLGQAELPGGGVRMAFTEGVAPAPGSWMTGHHWLRLEGCLQKTQPVHQLRMLFGWFICWGIERAAPAGQQVPLFLVFFWNRCINMKLSLFEWEHVRREPKILELMPITSMLMLKP